MSIMLILLLAAGMALFWLGKINFGSIQTEGRHVKAAGAVLMLPAAGFALLSFLLSILFGGSNSSQVASALLQILQLVMMVMAVIVAYILIAEPPNAPHLPGILGQIQNERHGKPSQPPSSSSPKPKQPQSPQRPASRHPLESFMPAPAQPIKVAKVLSVKEAAAYMGVNPDEIMRLIDAGKLPAARDSSGFRIARSVLDELKNPDAT
jgi:excisionase family DNA binding protein